MSYFKPKSFLLNLRNFLMGKCTVEKVSSDREPLSYRISGFSGNEALLAFEVRDNKVHVVVEFKPGASEVFIADVSKAVNTVLKSEDGE